MQQREKQVSFAAKVREERLARGLTQERLAERIGTTKVNVSRWERGLTSASPYFTHQLATFFSLTEIELGLHPLPLEPSLLEEVSDPALPVVGGHFLGRELLFQEILAHLRESHSSRVALTGLPGVGKTSLAAYCAVEPQVRELFPDGVLWAGLGAHPDILPTYSRWASLLHIPPSEVTHLPSLEAWEFPFKQAIGLRRMLIILDDVWGIHDAATCLIGGPRCSYLVTTRSPSLARAFSDTSVIRVREFAMRESLVLLQSLVPELAEEESDLLVSLLRQVGGLPLALILIGKYLRKEAHGAQRRRIRTAILQLQDATRRMHLLEPQALLDRPMSGVLDISLTRVIRLSTEQLGEQERNALAALSLFAAKPDTFSEEAALAVTNVPAETLDALTDAGLLETTQEGRYQLHQTIADFARQTFLDDDALLRFLHYAVRFIEEHAGDSEALEQESSMIATALTLAERHERGHEFVARVRACAPFVLRPAHSTSHAKACS